MKKVIQINTLINSGSTGRIAEEIGQTAILNGWESYIAYGRNDQFSISNKIRIGNNWDIKMHGLGTRFFDKHGFSSINATKLFIREIDKIQPNIIHLHNIHGYYINIEILFNYLSEINIPILWTFHDCWPITGHCTHFSYIGCNKWKTQCLKCPQRNEYPASFLIDNSYNNYKRKRCLFTSVKNLTIIPVSYWLAELVHESFMDIYPIKVIHNGIDLSIFKQYENNIIREKYKLNNKFIILGVANNWGIRKGLNDFLKLSTLLKKDEIIVLVGLSKKIIKNLPPNIIGIERTENVYELAAIYSTSDVFLNPTWEDNFPTTNIEALACGTPVISYNTGGCSEALHSGIGFIVEQGNIDQLLLCLNIIKKKNKSYYYQACKYHSELYFNKKDRFEEYIQLYKDLIE